MFAYLVSLSVVTVAIPYFFSACARCTDELLDPADFVADGPNA